MPYAKNLKESAYGRDLDDRNDVKWSHPELEEWWVAGNADMIDMLCDESVPLEKRKKRVEKLVKATADMYKDKFDVWTGFDKKEEGSDYGHLERFQIKGCPEDPDADCSVSILIPNEKSDTPRHRKPIMRSSGSQNGLTASLWYRTTAHH